MVVRLRVGILAVILGATGAAAEPSGTSAAANTGRSILVPIEAEPHPAVSATTSPSAEEPDAVASIASSASDEARLVPPRSEFEDRQIAGESGAGEPHAWWRTLGALVLVVGLIFAARWFLSRTGARQGAGRDTGAVEVLSKTAVSPKHSVILLRVGSRLLVVGAGGEGMATLAEIDDAEQVSDLLGAVERSRAGSLSNSFARALGREQSDVADYDAPSQTAAAGAAERIRVMVGRLRNLGPAGRGRP